MAEESVILPESPEITMAESGNMRRNSIGKAKILNGGGLIPSHRRASTGSCHDSCKYGGHHEFEPKSRLPIPKSVAKKPVYEFPVEVVVLPERKLPERKKTVDVVVEPQPSPEPGISAADATSFTKLEVSKDSPCSQNPSDSDSYENKMTLVSKPKSSSYLKSHKSITPKTTKKEVLSCTSTVKAESNSKRASSTAKELNPPEKNDASPKPKSTEVKSVISLGSSGDASAERNSDIKLGKQIQTQRVAKKVLALPTVSLLSPKSVSGVASLNSRKQRSLIHQHKIKKAEPEQGENVEVKEKTLFVIKETKKKHLGSDRNETIASGTAQNRLSPMSSLLPNYPSRSAHEGDETKNASDISLSEDKGIDNIRKVENSNMNKGRSRRLPHSGVKDSSLPKLNLRKGKVIDVQSETNSPRGLKFRRGKVVVAENQKLKDARKRNFKSGVVDGNVKHAEPASEKVVLRHQDTQKKDEQGLFNNVIEETASKLARIRKSKVKALVGAFETVISLQERKNKVHTIA